MKLLICILMLTVLAKAEKNWSKIKPKGSPLPPIFLPQTKNKPRITGGEEADPHSIPYQVALFIPTEQGTAFCGGTLISPTTVLTAAHCADGASIIEIVLGAHYIREDEDSQLRINATDIIVHPNWNVLLIQNDVALVRFPAIELSDNIQVVNLPSRSLVENTFRGELGVASGWGKSSDDATTISETLQRVEAEIISNLLCNIYYLGIIQNSNICTSGSDGKLTCSGDSGGPLVVDIDGAPTQVGITSFGISFGCEIGWPAAFVRITEYLDFIEENSDVKIQE